MGDFAIKIQACGGHSGSTGPCSCKGENCVDCKAQAFVDWMVAKGYMMKSAQFQHWPSEANPDGEHIDDLLTHQRIK